MSVDFSTLKTQVGQLVGDTSTTFATIIGTYINSRYREVLRRTNWNSIQPDYTITATSASTVTSASTYTLPSDFGKELYVHINNIDIPHKTLEELELQYQNQLTSTGNIEHYSIFTTKDTSAASAEASAARVNKIRFWRAPSTDNTVLIPYSMRAADLSGDTDELVTDCETAIRYGAAADAQLYKRQYSKAQQMEGLYEKAIINLLWDKDFSSNRLPVMGAEALDRDVFGG